MLPRLQRHLGKELRNCWRPSAFVGSAIPGALGSNAGSTRACGSRSPPVALGEFDQGGTLDSQVCRHLTERTGLSSDKLEKLHQRFTALAGQKGYLSQEDFDGLTSRSETGLLGTLWGFNHFAALDRNRSGRIYFEEFVLGVATVRMAARSARIPTSILRRGNGRTPQLEWQQRPRSVLVVTRKRDPYARDVCKRIGRWLSNQGLRVLVEDELQLHDDFEVGVDDRGTLQVPDVDFMVCLGGDGTLLGACAMFNREEVVPPCISFGLGSLGFLTPFRIEDFEATLGKVLAAHSGEGIDVSLRSRLRCEVVPGPMDEAEKPTVNVVLNECLIDRGVSPHLCQLHLHVDNHYVTTVQADGLIVGTPSGSTAYSLSVGGSMVAPSVAGTLITPIAPHTLSFRPVIVDAGASVEIVVSEHSRGERARLTFDGRNEISVGRGGCVRIETSLCPVPLVNMLPNDSEWFQSIREKLFWNIRKEQKPFEE